MSGLDKSIERIKARPSEADFNDVRRVLEAFGWVQARQKGSHLSFTKPGAPTVVFPLYGRTKVKRVYLEEICAIIGLEE
jgi:predicted RNA binding protein YcfA (HicA-like mRNA interferase family)